MRAAVLTSSDAGAKGERDDASGRRLCELVLQMAELADYQVLPDEPVELEQCLWRWIRQGVDLIVTTGSTGLGPRDVMPEVTHRVIDREIPGMAEAMRTESLRHTPFGMISRQVAGVAEQTLIVNFPGSPKAVEELWPVVSPVLLHVVNLLHGKTRHDSAEDEKPDDK
jgi:molybdenum cofactor synthesis domain-containing protein